MELSLTGRTCDALVAREFWIDGRQISAACYVLLRLDDGSAIGWWFNDDAEVWQTEAIGVDDFAEITPFITDGNTWSYPHVDLAARFGVPRKRLKRLFSSAHGPVQEARLEFVDGVSIVFAYDCRRESGWVTVEAEGVTPHKPT